MSIPTPSEVQYYEAHAGDSLQPNLIASTVVGLFFAYLAVALRFYCRKHANTTYGADDWMIAAALLPLSAYGIIAFIQCTFGEGRHIIFVTNVKGYIQGYVTSIVAYSICVILTKGSILYFYCRIFTSKTLVYISIVFEIIVILYNIALIMVTAFQCIPLATLWGGAEGHCFNTIPAFTALAIFNVVTDFAILALPIRYIFRLQMVTTRKLQVSCVFLLGSLVCIFGIVRAVAVAEASTVDPSYRTTLAGIWSFCEIAIGIVAACLPTLGILFSKRYMQNVGSSARGMLLYPFRSRSAHASGASGERSYNMSNYRKSRPASEGSTSQSRVEEPTQEDIDAMPTGTQNGGIHVENHVELRSDART